MHNYLFPGMVSGWLSYILLPLIFWSIFWKGWALWRAARNGSKVWFIILLVVNTAGILDILYIFIFGKKATPKKTEK